MMPRYCWGAMALNRPENLFGLSNIFIQKSSIILKKTNFDILVGDAGWKKERVGNVLERVGLFI